MASETKSAAADQNSQTVVKILLYPSQTRGILALIGAARDETSIRGLLCTLNQILDLHDGRLLMELQVARLDRKTTLKIQELIRDASYEKTTRT
jgi:hypothetical protein